MMITVYALFPVFILSSTCSLILPSLYPPNGTKVKKIEGTQMHTVWKYIILFSFKDEKFAKKHSTIFP